MPSLTNLFTEKTRHIKIKGFEEDRMVISNNGINDIQANVKVDSLFLHQEGKNEIDLRGKGQFLKALLGKHSRLDAKKFVVNFAEIQADEMTYASIEVSDTLKQYGADNMRLKLEGEPVILLR